MNDIVIFGLGAAVALAATGVPGRFLGFAAQKPEDYAGQEPAFDIRTVLQGDILCEGVIYGPTGRVTSRFVADMDAKWDGNRCVMAEAFRYESGRRQSREWTLTLSNDGTIKAEAPDVIGTGEGRQEGNSVLLRYDIRLPQDAGGHVLSVTDWMYLTPNGTIINRSQFRKFGFKVAELVATMRRHPA
jgi:hypothetical protein